MFRQKIKNEKKYQKAKESIKERYFDEIEQANGLKSSRKPDGYEDTDEEIAEAREYYNGYYRNDDDDE